MFAGELLLGAFRSGLLHNSSQTRLRGKLPAFTRLKRLL
jgi:hypothetical protein